MTCGVVRLSSSRWPCELIRPVWPCWLAAREVITGPPRVGSWPISLPASWWPTWGTTRPAGGDGSWAIWGLDALPAAGDFFSASTLTAYNALTPLEVQASDALVASFAGSQGECVWSR